MRENKKCWACGKSLTGGEKLGLCDGCLNKYGTPAAAVAALGIGIGAKFGCDSGRQRGCHNLRSGCYG